jgi:phosphopantetheinyl transferase (holo-ACP synthase)
MSVIGHGIDLVEVAALHRWIEDPRDPLVPRCFTADELAEIGEVSYAAASSGGAGWMIHSMILDGAMLPK